MAKKIVLSKQLLTQNLKACDEFKTWVSDLQSNYDNHYFIHQVILKIIFN